MPEVTLDTLFNNSDYTASGHSTGVPGVAYPYSFTLVKYTQDQGQNPSNNSAFRLILDGFPDPILSVTLAGFFSVSHPEKDCPLEENCSEWTDAPANVLGMHANNGYGLTFSPLNDHDGGAYVRAAAKCPCNDSTKSRTVFAQVNVRTSPTASHPVSIEIIPCTNCDELFEEHALKQQHATESPSIVSRVDKSFDLLRAWNEYKI